MKVRVGASIIAVAVFLQDPMTQASAQDRNADSNTPARSEAFQRQALADTIVKAREARAAWRGIIHSAPRSRSG